MPGGITTEDVYLARDTVGSKEEIIFLSINEVGDDIQDDLSMEYHGITFHISKRSSSLVSLGEKKRK